MNCKNRLKLINSFSDIFSLKLGTIFKCEADKKCYRTAKWFSFFFHILYGEAILYLIIVFSLFVSKVVDSFLITMILSVIIFIFLELLFILIMPLSEIECWKKNMESERLRNKGIMKGKRW